MSLLLPLSILYIKLYTFGISNGLSHPVFPLCECANSTVGGTFDTRANQLGRPISSFISHFLLIGTVIIYLHVA